MELRLVVEASEPSPEPSLLIDGRRWILSKPYDIHGSQAAPVPSFSCISYLWGPSTSRAPHAFEPATRTMSTHTIPALTAAIRSRKSKAFWTDVFCVPSAEGPKRQATLESMGFIYSLASEAVIVLSDSSFENLQDMVNGERLSAESLRVLEQDNWVSSVWTYQEIVNSTSVYFVSERDSPASKPIEGFKFFSVLGNSLTHLPPPSSTSSFQHLSALLDLMADWATAEHLSRSALTVLSSMANKRNPNPENYIYAALGALSDSPSDTTWLPAATEAHLMEHFMCVCERRNDFSFIYTLGVRDSHTKRRWRPLAVPLRSLGNPSDEIPLALRPIFVWHCWGGFQRGRKDSEGRLWLEDMAVLEQEEDVGLAGRDSIAIWMQDMDLVEVEVERLSRRVYDYIKESGFMGEKTPLIVQEGLVFYQGKLDKDDVVKILVATKVRWRMGAPGMVVRSTRTELKEEQTVEYLPCMFVGKSVLLRVEDVLMI